VAETKNWASIIPLDYSTPEEKRLEFSVGFLSTDWESLTDLLRAPEVFLAEKQADWPQVNEHPERLGQTVEWRLSTPVSIHISPAKGNLPAVIKSAKSLGVSIEDAKVAAKSEASHHQMIAKMSEVLSKRVSELAPNGAYLAEFAPYTYVLKIHYWPPHHCTMTTAGSAAAPLGTPPSGRFNDPFTKATLGLIGEHDVAGTLHFDLGKGNDARARFIMDHIENCGRTCQKLNSEFPELFLVNTEFVPEGETILVRELGSQEHKPVNILQTSTNEPLDPRAPSVRLSDDATVAPEVNFPTIHVDGVSSSNDCYICLLMDITDTPTAYVAGDMDVKIYCGTTVANTSHCSEC